jgi:uncharacterized protein Usg
LRRTLVLGLAKECVPVMSDKHCGKLIVPDDSESEFARRLKGARLLTAEVLYYMPDHPRLLQTFMWQTLDEAPKFPRLAQFLDFWRREIDAVIHSVRVAHGEPLAAPAWRKVDGFIQRH